ncbi:pyridoxal phosphate-dependent decarboxylase family protein [Acidobacteriota bacterium]
MNRVYKEAIEKVEDLYDHIEDLRVYVAPDPDEIKDFLTDTYDFQDPVELSNLVGNVTDMLRKWNVQVTHPRYFGYFNPSVRPASILADLITAAYNPQLAVWSHSPAAVEMEQHVLRYFIKQFGMDPQRAGAHFTSGGSEANFTAVVAALTSRIPDFGETGLIGSCKKPVIYVSRAAHDSFGKICHMTGIGRNSLRKIAIDQNFKMDLGHLEGMIRTDLNLDLLPLMVVGTAGTTASGVIDPLGSLAELSRQYDLWYHIDAAWGGSAILSRKLKTFLDGIERADSITCDAHKWLSVPMGAGMFFSAHREPCEQAFRITTDYMPRSAEGVQDPYTSSVQWSRRFIGLKVFMAFAELGHSGYERLIDHQAEMGQYLKSQLLFSGWKSIVDTPFPVVSFTHERIEKGESTTDEILKSIYKKGKTWISEIVLGNGERVLRACICSYRTQKSDIEFLVKELEAALYP